MVSIDEIAARVSDPTFIPSIVASRAGRGDWPTAAMAVIAAQGGVARGGQINATIGRRKTLPEELLPRLRGMGLVTFTTPQWTGHGFERWVALDDRHPCMAELRHVLLVIARRLPPDPRHRGTLLEAPPPPFDSPVAVDMGVFFGDASRTRLLTIAAHVAPITMYDLSGYAAVSQEQGHKGIYRLVLSGLASIFHSDDEHGRVWVTLNHEADYGEALRKLVRKVASFQPTPFAGLKKVNDAKTARLIREGTKGSALLDRLRTREAILDT